MRNIETVGNPLGVQGVIPDPAENSPADPECVASPGLLPFLMNLLGLDFRPFWHNIPVMLKPQGQTGLERGFVLVGTNRNYCIRMKCERRKFLRERTL